MGVFTVDVQRRGVRHRIELVTQLSASYERVHSNGSDVLSNGSVPGARGGVRHGHGRQRRVCGSDGRWYRSHCHLHREACLAHRRIRVDRTTDACIRTTTTSASTLHGSALSLPSAISPVFALCLKLNLYRHTRHDKTVLSVSCLAWRCELARIRPDATKRYVESGLAVRIGH